MKQASGCWQCMQDITQPQQRSRPDARFGVYSRLSHTTVLTWVMMESELPASSIWMITLSDDVMLLSCDPYIPRCSVVQALLRTDCQPASIHAMYMLSFVLSEALIVCNLEA